MDNQIDVEIKKLQEIEDRIKTFEDLDYASKVTLERGRSISQIKKIIKLLEKKQDKNEDELKLLDQYYTKLSHTFFTHKRQISDRYNKEFIHGEAKVPDVVTTLPKALGLQAKKIASSINELIYSRGKMAKTNAVANFAKETGLFVATPIIFAGKFAIEHWYLLLLLWAAHRNKRHKTPDGPSEEPVLEPELDPVTVEDPALDPTTVVVGDPVEEPVGVPGEEPGVVPGLEPVFLHDPQFGWNPATESGLAWFTRMLRESGVLGNASVYATAENAVKAIPALSALPMDIALRELPNYARNLNIVWVIGPGGLFATEELFMQAISQNVASFDQILAANPAITAELARVSQISGTINYSDLLSGISVESIAESLGVTVEVATAAIIIYGLAKLALAVPTYGATLAIP